QPVVAWVLEQELGGFPNDRLLAEELAHEPESLFRILVTDLKGDVAPNLLTSIIAEVDAQAAGLRKRYDKLPNDKREWLRRLIKSVTLAATSGVQQSLFKSGEDEDNGRT